MTHMPLINHLTELRQRLSWSAAIGLIGAILSFLIYDSIIQQLSVPFETISKLLGEHTLYISSLLEGFFTKIKISLLFGFIVTSPFHLFNLLRFILPGLKSTEKKILFAILTSSLALSLGSFYLGYFKLLPFSVAFLTSHNFIPQSVGLLLNFNDNIFLVLNFIIYTIILFQTPIIIEFLLYTNVLSRQKLLRSSRYIIVGIFLLSAIVTPPDIISQIGLAVPLIILFYLTILIAKIGKFGEP